MDDFIAEANALASFQFKPSAGGGFIIHHMDGLVETEVLHHNPQTPEAFKELEEVFGDHRDLQGVRGLEKGLSTTAMSYKPWPSEQGR